MPDPIFIGVDAGMSGAIAVYYPSHAGFLSVFPIPSEERKLTSGKVRHDVDTDGLGDKVANSLAGLARSAVLTLIERGAGISMPKGHERRVQQSPQAAYNYGFANGVIFRSLKLYSDKVEFVEPAVWKRHFGLIGKDKDASRALAADLFPAFTHFWKGKTHHGRAEAALIARYAEQVHYA